MAGRKLEPIVFPFFQDIEDGSLHVLGSVQTWAFNLEEKLPEPFALADMLTLSGLRAAASLAKSGCSRWPLRTAPRAAAPSFAEGARTDNSGLMALLQRRVSRLVWPRGGSLG